ncbi:MAG TPA: HisA/HisF-related TIM barrel protein, partial [Pyrinomonadaceae bacterium]
HGAGEIIIQSVDSDGTMRGYDIALVNAVSRSVSVPVVALGGAGTLDDLSRVVREGRADAVAAGSMFVYLGPAKAVLINYPARGEVNFE